MIVDFSQTRCDGDYGSDRSLLGEISTAVGTFVSIAWKMSSFQFQSLRRLISSLHLDGRLGACSGVQPHGPPFAKADQVTTTAEC